MRTINIPDNMYATIKEIIDDNPDQYKTVDEFIYEAILIKFDFHMTNYDESEIPKGQTDTIK